MVQNANAKSALPIDSFLEAQKEVLPRKGFILCSPSSVLYNTKMHICPKNSWIFWTISFWGNKASEDSVVPALPCTWHLCWVGSELGFGFWGLCWGCQLLILPWGSYISDSGLQVLTVEDSCGHCCTGSPWNMQFIYPVEAEKTPWLTRINGGRTTDLLCLHILLPYQWVIPAFVPS